MTESVLIIFGLISFIDVLFKKWNTYESIQEFFFSLSELLNLKLFYDLASCRLCQRFWMTVLLTLLLGLFSEFTYDLILIPMIVIGIFNLKKE